MRVHNLGALGRWNSRLAAVGCRGRRRRGCRGRDDGCRIVDGCVDWLYGCIVVGVWMSRILLMPSGERSNRWKTDALRGDQHDFDTEIGVLEEGGLGKRGILALLFLLFSRLRCSRHFE